MSVRLPLHDPPFTSYLFLLYPLAILARDRAYLPWLYGTHLQWFVYPGEELKLYVHPLSLSHSLADAHRLGCPLLEVQSLEVRALRSLAPEPETALIRLLEQGYYVQLDLDHYFLPFRVEYRRRHYLHEVLLYGHDLAGFSALAYDGGGQIGTYPLPGACLVPALATPVEVYLEDTARLPGGIPPWFGQAMAGRPRIFLFRYGAEPVTPLDLDERLRVLIEQLDDYLTGRNSSERYRLVAPPRPGGAWGIQVYPALAEAIERAASGAGRYPAVPLRLLWEHKRCMAGRLAWVEETGRLPAAAGLANRWTAVTDLAESLRLVLLRWAATGRASTLAEANRLLAGLAATEKPLLRELLDGLRERSGAPRCTRSRASARERSRSSGVRCRSATGRSGPGAR
jgi:hypothetical protein